MRSLSQLFRFPRPKSFLCIMTLRTGMSLATLTLILNKIPAGFGLLSLLTDFQLAPLQLSMYIYSLTALCLITYNAPQLLRESPLHVLALSCFQVLDLFINTAYSAIFATSWFLVLANQHNSASDSFKGFGGSTIDETSGFTSPEYNVSHVAVIVAPASSITAGQDAVTVGTGLGTTPELYPERTSSIVLVVMLFLVRVYLTVVVLSYARFVLHRHVARSEHLSMTNDKIENPFSPHLAEGHGWQGKLGRALIMTSSGYWLGKEEADSWMDVEQGKDAGERERRRRSGTGPSELPKNLVFEKDRW